MIEVNGKQIQVEKFTTLRGIQVATMVAKTLGPALEKSFGEKGEANPVAIATKLLQVDYESLHQLLSALWEVTLVRLTPTTNWIKMNEGTFNQVFEDDYMGVGLYLKYALEINFARFLAGVGIVAGEANGKVQSPSTSPQVSTG